jgi:hypothetical protein
VSLGNPAITLRRGDNKRYPARALKYECAWGFLTLPIRFVITGVKYTMANTRWKEVKDVEARTSLYNQIALHRINTPITIAENCKFTRYPAKRANGSHTWRNKGGFITVTSGNGIGIVPQAFTKNVRTC